VYKVPLPYVMGHEPAGKVAQVGEGVTDYQVGDKVAVSGLALNLRIQSDDLILC
jgi:D-arabinose 1-dehydrogenase-like Zn-dependent alcohol dehydrogenase